MAWNPYPYPPYYPQQGYVPQQAYPPQPYTWGGQAYTDAYAGRPPVASPHSNKYPTLNPLLAADTTMVRFDIKKSPRSDILASTYYQARNMPAKSTPTNNFHMICKSFPWSIEVQSAANVSCENVWDAIWGALQEPIADSEWGLIIQDKKTRERVEGAVKKRLELDPGSDKRPKRIDFLGDETLFKGLEKDDEYQKLRQLPGSQPHGETWIIRVTS